jgi:hypothetical protein
MYRDNQPLFLKLASQSKHLSTSKNALFDTSSGSGLPASSSSAETERERRGVDGQATNSRDRRAIGFREMEDAEVDSIKKRIQERYAGDGVVIDGH